MTSPPRSRRTAVIAIAAVLSAIAAIVAAPYAYREVRARVSDRTVADRLAEVAPRVEPLWRARLSTAGFDALPDAVTVVILKAERTVSVFATDPAPARKLAEWPITAASGSAGPKLREGDRQVPEGVYRIESLNPNSRYHLALRVNYPSDEDRHIAASEGRTNLGGDIMIHGGAASIGCVAIGDPAIEELFWLVATVGIERVELLFAPDASPAARITESTPEWVADRYRLLSDRLATLEAN